MINTRAAITRLLSRPAFSEEGSAGFLLDKGWSRAVTILMQHQKLLFHQMYDWKAALKLQEDRRKAMFTMQQIDYAKRHPQLKTLGL